MCASWNNELHSVVMLNPAVRFNDAGVFLKVSVSIGRAPAEVGKFANFPSVFKRITRATSIHHHGDGASTRLDVSKEEWIS